MWNYGSTSTALHMPTYQALHRYIHKHKHIDPYMHTYIPTYLRTYMPTYTKSDPSGGLKLWILPWISEGHTKNIMWIIGKELHTCLKARKCSHACQTSNVPRDPRGPPTKTAARSSFCFRSVNMYKDIWIYIYLYLNIFEDIYIYILINIYMNIN